MRGRAEETGHMQDLTYHLPYERLQKLGRAMGRKAYRRSWINRWGLIILYFAVLAAIAIYSDEVDRWFASMGIPAGATAVMFVLLAILFYGMRRMRKAQCRELQSRVNFDQAVHLTREAEGVRIGTQEIEYFIRWPGITQLLMEPDGVVISHGSLFFLVPDSAFATAAGRNAFIRNIYARLGDEAKAKSDPEIGAVLARL
jgi:hypothetical protein